MKFLAILSVFCASTVVALPVVGVEPIIEAHSEIAKRGGPGMVAKTGAAVKAMVPAVGRAGAALVRKPTNGQSRGANAKDQLSIGTAKYRQNMGNKNVKVADKYFTKAEKYVGKNNKIAAKYPDKNLNKLRGDLTRKPPALPPKPDNLRGNPVPRPAAPAQNQAPIV